MTDVLCTYKYDGTSTPINKEYKILSYSERPISDCYSDIGIKDSIEENQEASNTETEKFWFPEKTQ
jgi:hypothetical protein